MFHIPGVGRKSQQQKSSTTQVSPKKTAHGYKSSSDQPKNPSKSTSLLYGRGQLPSVPEASSSSISSSTTESQHVAASRDDVESSPRGRDEIDNPSHQQRNENSLSSDSSSATTILWHRIETPSSTSNLQNPTSKQGSSGNDDNLQSRAKAHEEKKLTSALTKEIEDLQNRLSRLRLRIQVENHPGTGQLSNPLEVEKLQQHQHALHRQNHSLSNACEELESKLEDLLHENNRLRVLLLEASGNEEASESSWTV